MESAQAPDPAGGDRRRLTYRPPFTQASLAGHLGITPKHVNQVLSGKIVGSPDLLTRMAEAVGLGIAIVVTGREPVPLAEDKRPWKSGNWGPRAEAAPEAPAAAPHG